MGLQDDLGMSGNDFSWLATAFFIAYAVAEVPQGALLQQFPITKVLGVNVFLWGVFLCCSSATKNYPSMMALRILLGIVEAVIGMKFLPVNTIYTDIPAPALTMYTSMWYTRAESTPRYGFWYCGLGAGQIVGGIISFGAQHAPKEMTFNGWRIMFVVIGAVNILVSVLVFFVLPETPDKARFLTEPEKQRIALRLTQDQAGVGTKVFRWRSLLEAFGDLQTWLLVLLTILITIPSGVITTFSSILIKGFGYTSMQSALLNMPSGVVSILSTMLSTYAIAKGFSRWFAIVLLLIPTLVGSCLMSFLPHSNQAGLLVGIYMVNTVCYLLLYINRSNNSPDGGSSSPNLRLDRRQLQRLHDEGSHAWLDKDCTDTSRYPEAPSYPLVSASPILSDPRPFNQETHLSKHGTLNPMWNTDII